MSDWVFPLLFMEELRASWEVTRCTVMSDGWTDQKGRTLINFLFGCPKGAMFMKFVNAFAHVKMHDYYVIYWMCSFWRWVHKMLSKS